MNATQAKRLSLFVARLFPGQLNEAQVVYLRGEFRGLDEADVDRAVRAHRGARPKGERVDIDQLLAECRAASAKPASTEPSAAGRETALLAAVRRQRPDMADRSDAEVLLRYWWGDFRRAADRAAEFARSIPAGEAGDAAREAHRVLLDAARQRVSLGCARSLMSECGMDEAEARRLAETCFYDTEAFRSVLADLRGELPVLVGVTQ